MSTRPYFKTSCAGPARVADETLLHVPLHVLIHGVGAPWAVTNLDETDVQRRFVEPWLRGEPVVGRGRHFNAGVYWLRIYEGDRLADAVDDIRLATSVRFNATEVTEKYITAPFGAERPAPPARAEAADFAEDRRKVMVVHGRDGRLRKAMFDFLRSVDLRPLEWSELVGSVNAGAPYIGEVLDAAFAQAQAVVVLSTPDDVAWLRDDLVPEGDPDSEGVPKGQPRPNVFLEAGMAIGRFPTRTIFTEVGMMRPASDLAGRHAVRLDSGPECRRDLAQRLERAGCLAKTDGTDWLSAGDFSLPPTGDHASAAREGSPDVRRRIERLREDLAGQDGFVVMEVADVYNTLLEEAGASDLPRAEPQQRTSMTRTARSRMTGRDMRLYLGQLSERLS